MQAGNMYSFQRIICLFPFPLDYPVLVVPFLRNPEINLFPVRAWVADSLALCPLVADQLVSCPLVAVSLVLVVSLASVV